MNNPLLSAVGLTPLPSFDQIHPEHAEPAIDAVLEQNRAELAQLLESNTAPSWASLVEPLEDMGDRVHRAWGPVSHLFSVTSSAAWRAAFNACLPKVTEYGIEVSQSEPLYRAYQALADSAEFKTYNHTRRKVVDDALRDFKLSGIALPADQKARYKDISLRLSELQTKFEEHLMDAIQAFSKPVTEASLLAGMTDAAQQS
ncbi:MAG: oligopeptidase A, partial [Solimonas sp.]